MKKLLLILFLFQLSFAKTIIVDQNLFCIFGSCFGGCDTGDVKEKTISDALNIAVNGDTIKICKGDYQESNLIIDKNIILESTKTDNIDDVKIYDNSSKPIFYIKGWRDGVKLNKFEIEQKKNNKIAIKLEKGENFDFSNLNIVSKGYGIYQKGGDFQNSTFEDLNISSKKDSIYLDKTSGDFTFKNLTLISKEYYGLHQKNGYINKAIFDYININSKKDGIYLYKTANLNFDDLNITSTNSNGIYLKNSLGDVKINKKNRINKVNSYSDTIYIGGNGYKNYEIKNFDIYSQKSQAIRIVSNKNVDISNGVIKTDEYSGIRIDNSNNDVNINDVNITINSTSNKAIYIKNTNKFNLSNSILNGAKYGVYLENSKNGGEIKNNIFKNSSDTELKIFINNKKIGYRIFNNCFEKLSGQNVLNKDINGYFDSNYYNDWNGNIPYHILNYGEDSHPQSKCNLDNSSNEVYQVCYTTSFDSQDEVDNNWTIIKQQNYTPQVVNGRLRLTTNQNNIATGLTLKNKVFKANGTKFKIRFQHFAYNGNDEKGADGIAVVFSDASIEPKAGAFGGSLGYAQRTDPNDEDGFAGGWIGIGLDEYGNYSNDNEGRVGGIGFTPQAVAIRGSYLEDYKYLIGTSSLNPTISKGNSYRPAPGYTYEISVDTTQQNKTIISVLRDTGNGMNSLINKYEYNSSNTPKNFRFSFTGSTGGSYNIHEIDMLQILAIDCNATLVKPPVIGEFYAKDANRSDKNITTKIVNDEFNISIDTNKSFIGTVCSAVVDKNEKNISTWKKVEFNNTKEENVSFNVAKADKNATIKIEWSSKKGTNIECPLENEYNYTTQNDRFAIRPYKYKIIFNDKNITAGKDFNITFQAIDKNGKLVKDYNETNSYIITAKEFKNICKTGKLDINGGFRNGENNATGNYAEIGDINITIEENSNCFACGVDGNESDLYIKKDTISDINSSVADLDINISFGNNIVFDDINLSSNYAEINTTIYLLNGKNDKVLNFDKNCYAKDVNISFDVNKSDIESYQGIYNINDKEENDSNFSHFDNNFTLSKDSFTNGEGNLSIKFNIFKNRSYPVSILDMNFTKVTAYLDDNTKSKNLDNNISFYYLRLYADDIYTTDINSSDTIYILVYDKFQNHFSDEKLLNWFVNTKYNNDDVKVLGYTLTYKYDENITNFEANITKLNYDFNLSISNKNEQHFVVIHLKTPPYLWYSKYKDYNDSLNSYCLTHYCVEYVYQKVNQDNTTTKDVGSGTFEGSEVNITTPKQKRFGIKIYR